MLYYILLALIVILAIIGYLIIDAFHFQHLHPDDLVKYAPMYGLNEIDEGEDE